MKITLEFTKEQISLLTEDAAGRRPPKTLADNIVDRAYMRAKALADFAAKKDSGEKRRVYAPAMLSPEEREQIKARAVQKGVGKTPSGKSGGKQERRKVGVKLKGKAAPAKAAPAKAAPAKAAPAKAAPAKPKDAERPPPKTIDLSDSAEVACYKAERLAEADGYKTEVEILREAGRDANGKRLKK